jgi:hypothetical protein
MYCETPTEPECNAYATGEAVTWTAETGEINVISGNQTTYTNSEYWLSFTYSNNRNITTEINPSSNENCSLQLTILLSDLSKPLQCYEPDCVPNIQPSIRIDIRKTNLCTWFSSTCNALDWGFQSICQQLKDLWIPEDKAAKTISLRGTNGSNYNILQWTHWYILKWSFIDGIVNTTRALLIEKNWYGVQIIDNEWMYTDVFDDFIKTFNYN